MAENRARKVARTLLGAALVVACERTEQSAYSASPSGSNTAGAAASAGPGSVLPRPQLDLTPPSPEPRTLGLSVAPHAVGERAESRDYVMTLVRVATCEVEPHFRPAAGRIKLGVDVLIEARSEREVPANPFLATLRDDQDRDYPVDLAGCTPTLRADRLTRDGQARGFITFEVPADATGLVMTYTPFVVGVGPEALSFALGR
ncbi:MAG TPA: DUF4352 domain-containing protein [Polyangiaceae bacterium]